jgi:ParB family chromosome partitioning protein
MVTKRLGRGLHALIPDVPAKDGASPGIRDISVSQIRPNPFQPRTEFDPQGLDELKRSISENGLITPVTVRPFNSAYQLIAGERRLRAVQELGYESIPAYVLEVHEDAQMLELALIENVQRENLNPIEEALGYQRLIDECRLTQEQVAQKVGKDRVTITNALRILKLPEVIRESVRKGEISAGHARALLGVADKQDQLKLWKKIQRDQLSVRQVENFAKPSEKPHTAKKSAADKRPYAVREAEDVLRRILGTQVHLHLRGKGGVIEIEFYSENDLERLLELFHKL